MYRRRRTPPPTAAEITQRAADQQHRAEVCALARLRLACLLSPAAFEAFDELVVWLKTDGKDAAPMDAFRLMREQPTAVYHELVEFVHNYERAGGTVYDYAARRQRLDASD